MPNFSDTTQRLTFDEILSHFKGVKRIGDNKAKALCPAHADRNPSLDLTYTAEGATLGICRAGCDFVKNVCPAAGLDIKQLMPPSNGRTHTTSNADRIVQVYQYTDADGTVLFEKVRYLPKRFAVRRPDSTARDGYTYNLQNVPRPLPLYRLPELLEAIKRGEAVGVGEGEKDADRVLRETGIACTCNFDGAGKWRKEYSDVLRAAKVVYLFADNDAPGRAHVRAIAKQLPNARIVEFPDLPEHGDVSDYLATHTADELLEVCQKVSSASQPLENKEDAESDSSESPSSRKLADGDGEGENTTPEVKRGMPEPLDLDYMLDEPAPPIRYMFDGLVPCGAIGGFVGQGGIGKGWLTVIMILCACIGRALLSVFTPVGWKRVLWIQSEDPGDEIHRRIQKVIRGYAITAAEIERLRHNLRIIGGKAFPLVAKENGIVTPTVYYRELQHEIADFDPDILVLDPLAHFVAVDENSNPDMSATLSLLHELVRPDAVVWINHHTSKALETTATSAAARGASAIRDSVRAAFALTPVSTETIKACAIQSPELFIEMTHTKANWNPKLADGVLFQRDVDTLGGLLRQVDVAAIKREVEQSDLDRLAHIVTNELGDNPDGLSKRDIYMGPKGKTLRDSIKDSFGADVSNRRLQSAIEYAETMEYITVTTSTDGKHGSPAKLPRRNEGGCPF